MKKAHSSLVEQFFLLSVLLFTPFSAENKRQEISKTSFAYSSEEQVEHNALNYNWNTKKKNNFPVVEQNII